MASDCRATYDQGVACGVSNGAVHLTELVALRVLSICAAVCAAMAAVPTIASQFSEKPTEHSGKWAAIWLIASIAIFSQSWVVSLGAVFLIALPFVDHRAVHTLAAIIRGNDKYFDTLVQPLGSERREERVAKEISNTIPPVAEGLKKEAKVPQGSFRPSGPDEEVPVASIPQSEFTKAALDIEKRALDWFESSFNAPLYRSVRVTSQRGVVEVDGYSSIKKMCVEVKVLFFPGVVNSFVASAVGDGIRISETIPDCNVYLILVVRGLEHEGAVKEALGPYIDQSAAKNVRPIVMTFNQLGLEETFGQESV